MPIDSRLYRLQDAQMYGIGATLHMFPPGLANPAATEHSGATLLCQQFDMPAISPFDTTIVTPNVLAVALEGIPAQPPAQRRSPRQIDLSYGGFPWWLLMAGHYKHFDDILGEGIISVIAIVERNGERHLRITTTVGNHIVSINGRSLQVRKQ